MAQTTDYINLSQTGSIAAGKATLCGMFVSQLGSAPTIYIYDALSVGGTQIITKFVPTAIGYYPLGNVNAHTGFYAGIDGNPVVTFFVKQSD